MPLKPRAVELLKQGQSADALHWQFVGEGYDPEEVRAVLTELVALQHQAAAMDPARLREEAKWMLFRGASIEDVVQHFVRVGIPEEHARPEAQRIEASVARLRPCQRCGTPTDPEQFYMDLSGFKICRGCNLRDEIGRSEQRGIARDLEAVGALGVGGMLVTSMISNSIANQAHGMTANPFCAHCKQPSGFHVAAVDPQTRARLDPTAEWVCRLCWQKIK